MSKSKHTPGPWQLADRTGERIVVKRTVDNLCSHIARTKAAWICDEHGGDADANAALIAAAPELLAALEAIVDCGDECPTALDMVKYMRASARAAIAKATGE